MHRILPHLTVAVLGLTPLAFGAGATSEAALPQAPAVSCSVSCDLDACPMPGCCDEECPMSATSAAK